MKRFANPPTYPKTWLLAAVLTIHFAVGCSDIVDPKSAAEDAGDMDIAATDTADPALYGATDTGGAEIPEVPVADTDVADTGAPIIPATAPDTDVADPAEGTDTGEAAPLPLLTPQVDVTVQPFVPSLPPFTEGGPERPLSAVAEEGEPVATFVSNELVVFSDDDEAVDALAERIGGERLFSEDPEDAGVEGPGMHLIVVNEPIADLSMFHTDIESLKRRDDGEHGDGAANDDGEHGDGAANDDGEHGDEAILRFSDERGMLLAALAARESETSTLTIGINWVAVPAAIPQSTEEAPDGQGGYYDAYGFDWFAMDSGMKTGVTEAWNLLDAGGRMDNKVKIAILDMGFKVTDDLADVSASTVWPGFGPLNEENIFPCSGGSACPWHGTDVAGAAMGIPDNQFGSAGPAGPVAEPVLVYTTYDYLASITAVYRARSRGAKIINMSYSAAVPWWLKWTTAGFRHATSAVRDSGVLLFAAAGNSGRNVDSKTCFLGHCWEKTFYTPCENGGVTCVGGLSGPSQLDSGSNYGDHSVDLYGPWCVQVGPNPEDDAYHQSCGTSISSPFVAGAAALVWAANPSLSASDVAGILADTADGYLEQKVNVQQAVLTASGTLSRVDIIDPADGSERVLGIPDPLTADMTFVSQPGSPIDVILSWHSSLDGDLGSESVTVTRTEGSVHSERVYHNYLLSEGVHTITVTAEYEAPGNIFGMLPPVVRTDQATVSVVNPAPTVVIETPFDGDTFCEGETILFRAQGDDINQTLGDANYSWIAARDTQPYAQLTLLGDGAVISTDLLAPGNHHVTVTVTDEQGAYSSDAIDIQIISASDPACSDLPPQVAITAPESDTVMMATGYDETGAYADVTLQASASDYEDAAADLTVEWYDDTHGLIATGADTTARIYMTDTCSSTHTITARVTDTDGHTAEDAIVLHIYIVC